jgi:hypothetical protein
MRVRGARPDLATRVERITKLYIAVHHVQLAVDARVLARAVTGFAPSRARR